MAVSRQAVGPWEKFPHGFLFWKWAEFFHSLHDIGEVIVWFQPVQHLLHRLCNLGMKTGRDFLINRALQFALMEDAKAYLQLTQQEQLICALTGQHSKATMLVRIAQVLGHLSYSLGQYKEALTKFAERLNEPDYDRTPDGYAAMFGQFFKGEPTLSLDNPAWMTLTNASVQYVAAVRPGKTEPQLVKRMHYVSFVGMFRSDLFEGLCVGHAPKKCPICGRWFLTIDARHTKYCGGLAPGDQRGRTCRQIGNLRGREQRELADDHPIKAIYTRRMNTILQSTRRGKLDEETAAAMKKLAKDKMLRALSDQRYASTVYEQEMTQDALLKAVQKK